MNLGHVSRQVGILLMLLAGAMSTSLPVAWLCGDPASAYLTFGASSGLTLVAGALFWWLGRKASGTLFRREALAIVGVSWLLIGFFGGLPYVFEGALPNFVDAYFETVSGFSTTGSTVLTNIEGLTEALHWWRTMTHWLGGIGIVVIFVAIFPQLGVGGKLLFKTEVPGPITEGLRPKIRETSLALFWIYLAFTLILAGLLYVVGPDEAEALARGRPNAEMDWHNAFAHSFATMGTGGFSTLNDSVAGFDSVAVDLLLTLFMFLAGVNFGLYYVALQSGWRVALRDRELWMYAGVILAATVVVTANIWGSGDPGSAHALKHEGLWPSARYAAFQVVSVVTTTGFGTDNFELYPPLGKLVLVFLMFLGGMAGSTAGGMKMFRFLVMFKAIGQQVLQVFRPAQVQVVRINRKAMRAEVVQSILSFLLLGLVIFTLASLYMAWLGLDVVSATTSVAATLFNVGPGLAKVGSVENFAFIPTSGKVVLSLCMVMGRLEFYSILVLLVPAFWRE
jgi:trk system potassium uptake protein TrkH